MNTINSRIIYLWQQFSAHKATRAELDELMTLLSSGHHDEVSREYLQQLLEATPAGEADPARWEPILQSILHPVEVPAVPSEKTGTASPVRRLVRRVMTAAAVLIVLAGLFRLWRQSREDSSAGSVPLVEVQPGGNKAVLTLAGGRKIVLDSVAAGVVAIEGNAHVEKLDDGKLAYQAGKEPSAGVLFNTLTTPRGGQYQLTLPDGTKVWLNAASSITYPTAFNGRERSVDITGEAYFEVAHDKRKPFKVRAGGQLIEDIGTHFNVNAYNDEPAQVTTLLEGAVRVDGQLLRPGEKATIIARDVKVAKGDPEQAVAWKNGLFEFSDAGLDAVMRQLARWYNVEVTYEGDIPSRQFNGSIGRTLTLDQVLKGLAKERVHYRIEENRHLIITP